MPRDHFAQARRNPNRQYSETERNIEQRIEDKVGAICGMLYSVVTLKCFFPKYTAPEMTNNPVKDAASGDQKDTNKPLV